MIKDLVYQYILCDKCGTIKSDVVLLISKNVSDSINKTSFMIPTIRRKYNIFDNHISIAYYTSSTI